MEKLSNAGVNSWLIRLRKVGSGSSQILSYYKIQFASDSTKFRKKFRNISSGSVGVNYTAASVSTRLSNLNCPAFGHRKRITDLEVQENIVGPQSFVISAANFDYVNAKVESLGYQPVIVNGGKSLIGKYSMDIALYESSSKRKRTSFKPFGNIAIVKKSEDEIIKGCEGVYVSPLSGEDNDAAKQFKFGR